MIKSLTARVQSLMEARPNDQLQVLVFSPKAIQQADTATNNPQWINRALFLLVGMLKFATIPTSAITIVPKLSDEAMKRIMLGLSYNDNKDGTFWADKVPSWYGHVGVFAGAGKISCLMNALWILFFSATILYKDRYEGKSGPSSSFGSQKTSHVRSEEGLGEACMHLKHAMRKQFKVLDGEEFLEIHKNECVCISEDPIGPCKTCHSRGEVIRHWVWRCPHLE